MNNNKQSSVEWYIIERHNIEIQSRLGLISPIEYDAKLIKIEEQAKAMHKEEQEQLSAGWAKLREQTRETAMHIGFARGFESGLQCYEDYYEELDKTDLDEDDFTRNYIVDRFEEVYMKDNKTEQTNN